MEFPCNWNVFPAEDFGTAAPRQPGETGMELFVQVRPNGRMLDHFRIGFGGTRLFEVSTPLRRLINSDVVNGWTMLYQFWGRDVNLRRNMTTSKWFDVYLAIKSGDINIYDEEEKHVPAEKILKILDAMDPVNCNSAVLRYAAAVGDDNRMYLEVQSLPMTKNTVEGKPSYNG